MGSNGCLWLGNISRFLTIENKIFCAEERRNTFHRYKIEYWVQQYDLRGKDGYPDYTRMDEYSFNQNQNCRPDINLEIAAGFNSLIACDKLMTRSGFLDQQKKYGIRKWRTCWHMFTLWYVFSSIPCQAALLCILLVPHYHS